MSELTICKNCGVAFIGSYCNHCGEKRFTHHDRSLLHVLEEGFHFITHLDGTLFTTVKTMITSPGKFSADYCTGVRKKYFKPLSFFLLIVVLYLIFPFFEGLNMQLKFYMQNGYYGKYATAKVLSLQSHYASPEALAESFHHKTEKISKFLLFILIPVMAAFSYLMTIRKKRFYYDHFIFSTEILSFFLLWGFLIFPLLVYLFLLITKMNFIPEGVIGGVIYTTVAIYTAIASRRFFRLKVWQSILYSLIYAVLLTFTLHVVYKFILFNIAVWKM